MTRSRPVAGKSRRRHRSPPPPAVSDSGVNFYVSNAFWTWAYRIGGFAAAILFGVWFVFGLWNRFLAMEKVTDTHTHQLETIVSTVNRIEGYVYKKPQSGGQAHDK